jgi:MYXO-CTERM domain-containing protein
VTVEVLESDDRLRLTTDGRDVIVFGYDGEPYLRITGDGVFRNASSPASYLNEDRYGNVQLPDEAVPGAPPAWEKIDDGSSVEWHDHRIHWMSTTPPPVVKDDPDSAHHILDWEVPLEVEGRPVTVAGTLDYSPPDDSGFPPLLVIPPLALLGLAVFAWWRRRR